MGHETFSADRRAAMSARVAQVRDTVDIVDVIGAVVVLGRGARPRGKCPFHGSNSDSFAVDPKAGRAICWGCGWKGDAIAFVRDLFGLDFVGALEHLESGAGIDPAAVAPVRREKAAVARPPSPSVESIEMGRFIWRRARPDPAALRPYLAGRGIDPALLTPARLANVRFLADAPVLAWRVGADPASVPHAPAMVALVRRRDDAGRWAPCGVHVTWLTPARDAKMVRKKADGSLYPARKMLGPVGGGAVIFPGGTSGADVIAADCPLFVGEGIETALSGVQFFGGGEDATALAVLSLDNLQGSPHRIGGALPMYDIRPDARSGALCFAHGGPVTGLIDADMKPLRGPRDRVSGQFVGEEVIERRPERGQRFVTVRRAISSDERAAICARLFAAQWRACGCSVRTLRPRMGQDFNDVVREVVR